MGFASLLFSALFLWTFIFMGTHQLQSSQTQVVLQLRKLLEYPKELEIWSNKATDFCYVSSPQANMTCENNFVTELRILGDKPKKVNNRGGFSISDQTLSGNFSMDSFLATLSRLNNLRVLTMVSLGIWGPFPFKIYRLSSLEYLDLSSNFLFGNVPQQISRMENIQSLIVDGNFLNGTFPDVFDLLPNLANLSLRDNHLTGELPSSLPKAKALNVIALSNNGISGKLPDLSSLNNLQVLDFSGNKLGPELPNLPKSLVMAFLNNNSFSSESQGQYSHLSQLQHLDLSSNSLSGSPPSQLFSLPNISSINLGSNMLSGTFPSHLKCGSQLQFVDVSNNKIIGTLPSCLRNTSSQKVVKLDGNCLSSELGNQHEDAFCLVVEREKQEKSSKGKSVVIITVVITGISTILLLLAIGLFAIFRRYCSRGTSEQHLLHKVVQENSTTGLSPSVLTTARYISEASKLGIEGMPLYQLFSLEELAEATNSFDKCTILGEGTYGKIYKGKLGNGTQVVIRCLTVSKKYTIRNLKLRLDLLAKLRHQHLVCLLGHCIENASCDANQVYLIYEYVSNGNYSSHLSERHVEKGLKWSERLAALSGIAKAVQFLHTGVIPGFFNNRLKSNNILLNEHRMAKLSDYGLSIVAEDVDNPEANGNDQNSQQMKSLEDDVYSFGYILLESLLERPLSASSELIVSNDMVSLASPDSRRGLVDPMVLGSSIQESLSIVIDLAKKCISPDSQSRPSFEDILWNLQYAAQVQTSTNSGEMRFEPFSRS